MVWHHPVKKIATGVALTALLAACEGRAPMLGAPAASRSSSDPPLLPPTASRPALDGIPASPTGAMLSPASGASGVGAVTPGFTVVPQAAGTPMGPVGAPEPYQYLGRAHYDGKPLLGLEADFDELAISPSGKRVAFRGREAMQDYVLFVADVDGAIRLLGPTALEPQGISWSRDEASLVYRTQDTTREGMSPNAPADVLGIPSGYTVRERDLASGREREITKLPGGGTFFPSPTHRHAAISGFSGIHASKLGAPFDLLDMATGQRSALGGGVQFLNRFDAALWSDDGRRLAVVDPMPPPDQGLRVVSYSEPAWTPSEVTRGLDWPGRIWWNATGDALETYHVTANQEIVFERVEASPQPLSTVSLDAPPPGHHYQYDLVGPSPGRHRFLFTRTATSTSGQAFAMPDDPALATTSFWIDRRSGKSTALAAGLSPIGWLDETRILAHEGRDQRKRLVVVQVTPSP